MKNLNDLNNVLLLKEFILRFQKTDWNKEIYGVLLNRLEEGKKAIDIIPIMKEYIKLLGDEMDKSASYLHVHGWKWEQSSIDKGIELREKIQEYEKDIV